MAKTARCINADGTKGRLKVKVLNRHRDEGNGEWLDGVFIFPQVKAASLDAVVSRVRHSPAFGPIVDQPSHITDSGQSGFLRYPLPWGVNSHPDFIALSRPGAGL